MEHRPPDDQSELVDPYVAEYRRWQSVEVAGETIVLAKQESVYFVADSTIRDSTILIDVSARALCMTHVRFINCTLRFKRQMTNFGFTDTWFEGCRISGRIVSCDFGRWTEDPDVYWQEAGIVNTDLSKARLHQCRFMNCDLSTLKLPRWPCFTMPYSEAVWNEARKLPWPGYSYVNVEGQEPEGTVAVTCDARRFVKMYGGTEEEWKALASRIPGVIM